MTNRSASLGGEIPIAGWHPTENRCEKQIGQALQKRHALIVGRIYRLYPGTLGIQSLSNRMSCFMSSVTSSPLKACALRQHNIR